MLQHFYPFLFYNHIMVVYVPVHNGRAPPGPGNGPGSGPSALPGQGNHLLHRRTRGAGGVPLDEEGEFDFEAGLAKFDKEKVKDKVQMPHVPGRKQ